MKEIQLKGKYGIGKVALVDDEDFDWLSQWKWDAYLSNKHLYAARVVWDGKKNHLFLMHREIMKTPRELLCDHADHNTLNNQKYNLRNCTKKQNNANRRSSINGSSRFLGVHKSLKRRKLRNKTYEYERWTAQILTPDGKKKCIGDFKTEEEAGRAYDEWAKKIHGEFANLNFK